VFRHLQDGVQSKWQQESSKWQIHHHNAHVYLSYPVEQSHSINMVACHLFRFLNLKKNLERQMTPAFTGTVQKMYTHAEGAYFEGD
jgi:hypothetical protein